MKKGQVCVLGTFSLVPGIVLVVAGILLTVYFSKQAKDLVEKGARLTRDSEAFLTWNRSEEIRVMSIRVFHVTNPEEVVQFGRNITVEEKGPFVYRVIEEKRDITFGEPNKTLSFHLTKIYTFDSTSSDGRSESEIVTVVNVPILSLVSKLRLNPNEEAAKELANSNETLFTNVSVADLVWGYTNPELKRINEKFRLFNDTIIGILHQTGVPSHTRDVGEFEVSTGTDDISSVWNIKQWNNQTQLNHWNSFSSNEIRGTIGYAWHPFLTSSDSLDTFDPDWCRSVYLSHEGQSLVDRLNAGVYSLPGSVLDSSRPENRGFCERTPDGQSCLAPGVLNITSCSTESIPWILSQPCFYQADPKFARAIHNLPQANKDRHESSMDIEMLSGEVINSRSRKQFNVFVKNESQLFNATTEFRSSIVIPVAWIEEEYLMAANERERLRDLAFRRHANVRTQYGVIGFGAFLLLVVIAVLIVVVVKMKISRGHAEWQPIPQH